MNQKNGCAKKSEKFNAFQIQAALNHAALILFNLFMYFEPNVAKVY